MTALNTLCSGFMQSSSDELDKLIRQITNPFFVKHNFLMITKLCTDILILSEVLQKAVKEDVNFKREGDWVDKYTLAIQEVKRNISYIQSHITNAEYYIDKPESYQESYIKKLMNYLDGYGTSFQTFLDASIMHKPDTRAGFENYKLNKVLKNVILQLDSICHQDTS